MFAFDPESANIRILNGGKSYRYTQDKDGLLYYDTNSHTFRLLYNDRNWQNDPLASLNAFNIDTGIYMAGAFDDISDDSDFVLALDTSGSEPVFYLNSQMLEIQYDGSFFNLAPDYFKNIFTDYMNAKSGINIFTGKYTLGSDIYHILIADTRLSSHRWFAGRVDTGTGNISFIDLFGENFTKAGYSGLYKFINSCIIYSTLNNGMIQFHILSFDVSNAVQIDSYNPLNAGMTFSGDFDYNYNPIVQDNSTYKYFNLASGRLEDLLPGSGGVEKLTLERNDLMNNYYPFQWIQGDYNGDGKTDIGIFNLTEPRWYFANTTGTVPDLISEVENGIGGKYIISYINSSSLDNTGDDGIPHLPMNYKICDKLTVEDGQGNRVLTRYEYSKGYAFSAFIDGFKETDYFGFCEFRVIDGLGGRNISEYNNISYQDFRMNRALAGAIKRTRFIGYDNIEYNRTEYDYRIQKIETDDAAG